MKKIVALALLLTKSRGFRRTISNRRRHFLSSSTHRLQASLNRDAWKTLEIGELQQLQQVAEDAARAAGTIIRENKGCVNDESAAVKTSIKDVVTQYDVMAQTAIHEIVRSKYPNHSFLGEEDVDPGAAASEAALDKILASSLSDYLWICDPIDGTANFASGLSMCAATIGIVYQGTPIVGVVYDPHADEMFSAVKGHGATVNGNSMKVQKVEDASQAIVNAGCPADPNAFATSVRGIQALNSETRGIRMIACSALTTAWIAAGRLTAHFGYDLSSWDLVAGALLIDEAGGLVTDLDGTPYQLETRNMLCSNGKVHESILKILRKADAVSFTRS